MSTDHLKWLAADIFNSETRRGWLANGCSWLGKDVAPQITKEKYVELFVERYKDRDINELEEMADIARPSNMPTAHERYEKLKACINRFLDDWDSTDSGMDELFAVVMGVVAERVGHPITLIEPAHLMTDGNDWAWPNNHPETTGAAPWAP
jgi:hypothetical protein